MQFAGNFYVDVMHRKRDERDSSCVPGGGTYLIKILSDRVARDQRCSSNTWHVNGIFEIIRQYLLSTYSLLSRSAVFQQIGWNRISLGCFPELYNSCNYIYPEDIYRLSVCTYIVCALKPHVYTVTNIYYCTTISRSLQHFLRECNKKEIAKFPSSILRPTSS